jgi:glycosyltransferase involved in cell wall biosynthesis
MRLLTLAGDADALIAQIRLRGPLQQLARERGWVLDLRSFHDCPWSLLARADVLVVQRGLSPRAAALQRLVRARGGAVIYVIDDLLTDLPAHISNHAAVWAAQAGLRQCLGESDLVTVSTARLGRELAPPHWAVVPNAAWPPENRPAPAARPGEPVTLLLASMEALSTDFLLPALRAVASDAVRIVAVGPPAERLAAAGVPVQAQALMARERFIPWVCELPNVVAVIPLEASRFAACKSAIKWFEYSHAGIPVLASAVSPYADVVQDGVTGVLVANDAAAWEAALRRVCSDAAWRGALAQAAQQDVRARFSFGHMVAAWGAAVDEALARRRQAHVPALGRAEQLRWQVWRTLEGPRHALRQFNRARLARRHAART